MNSVLERVGENIFWPLHAHLKHNGGTNTCLDVGSNRGIHSKIYVGVFDTVHAFEPSTDNRMEEKYKELLKLEKFVLHNYALGEREEKLYLHHCLHDWGLSSFNDDKIPQLKEYKDVEVQVKRLDDIDINTKIDFIKIDVETWEPKVIAGALETIDKHRPTIQCEYDGLVRDTLRVLFKELNYIRVYTQKGEKGDAIFIPQERINNV